MRPQWDIQIIQFNNAVTQLRSVISSLPPAFNTAQGVTVQTDEAISSLEELATEVEAVGNSNDIDPLLLGIHQNGVLPPIAQITALASSLSSNPNVTILDQIVQQAWSIRASIAWLFPKRKGIENFSDVISSADFGMRLETLKNLTEQYPARIKQLRKIADLANEQLGAITAVSDQIKGYERESSTAKINAEASASAAASSRDLLATQLSSLTDGVERNNQLFLEIETLRATAISTLESTSKVALAASFSNRKDKLRTEQLTWQVAFGIGILGLLFVGIASVVGWMTLPPIVIDNRIELGPILTRLALVGPMIWFTWFSVRSLSTTNRLIEDYAFKEASALAFVGYQREMKDDAEMIKLLRESAIHNFGNQPTRIFEKSDPASPLHDLFAKALDTGGIDKAVDLIKALRSGK
ncbi:MAG: hypothetical protein QE290_01290 [Acidovorax sp.]|uniref:hypothetical protein n=1 Tax=Acidovorax sp. TaxID=1872122 RepID=UPI0026262FAF|nr:hypothetical protein [Acidovorax sp.]MDH4462657.1 hypothetical protein [Acidovorax sp.]